MSIKNKIVQRKGSKTKWQVFGEDKDYVYLMNYNQSKPNSRMVKKDVFNKYWSVL